MKTINYKILPLLFSLLFFSSVQAQLIVTNGLSHEVVLKAGDIHEGSINIKNTGDIPTTVNLQQFDLDTDENGHFKFTEPGTLPRSNANWISFYPRQLELAGNSDAIITFRIIVPADTRPDANGDFRPIKPDGTFWSLASIISTPVQTNFKVAKDTHLAINTTVQYGVQLVTHIGKTKAPEITISHATAHVTETNRILDVELLNTGDLMVRPRVVVEIYQPDGTKIDVLEAKPGRIYPNAVYKNNFNLENLPSGKYSALVLADCGGEDVFGRQIMLTIEE